MCCADYMCHVYVRSDSLAAVLISDHEYPQRVAFTLINKVQVRMSKLLALVQGG